MIVEKDKGTLQQNTNRSIHIPPNGEPETHLPNCRPWIWIWDMLVLMNVWTKNPRTAYWRHVTSPGYSAVINACSRWQLAMKIFGRAQRCRCTLDLIAYNSFWEVRMKWGLCFLGSGEDFFGVFSRWSWFNWLWRERMQWMLKDSGSHEATNPSQAGFDFDWRLRQGKVVGPPPATRWGLMPWCKLVYHQLLFHSRRCACSNITSSLRFFRQPSPQRRCHLPKHHHTLQSAKHCQRDRWWWNRPIGRHRHLRCGLHGVGGVK